MERNRVAEDVIKMAQVPEHVPTGHDHEPSMISAPGRTWESGADWRAQASDEPCRPK